MTKVLTGMNITDEMSVEESLQLGRLANVIGKGLGQNTVYVINPSMKPVLPIKKVEDVFCRNKSEKLRSERSEIIESLIFGCVPPTQPWVFGK